MQKEFRGYCKISKPTLIIDDETGEVIPVYIPADAISKQAKPGYKAGNPLIDEINEELREGGLIKKFKDFYKILKPKK